MICLGAALVIRQEASPGTILAAAVITSRMLAPFEHLIDGWRQWVNAFAIARRLRDLLRDGVRIRSAARVPVGQAMIVVDRLSYVPPGQDAPLLRNVSFSIAPGEMVGVIGPSGAGKSALARLVVGLRAPTAGGFSWMDNPPSSMKGPASARRSAIFPRNRCFWTGRFGKTSPGFAMPPLKMSLPPRVREGFTT